MKTVVISQPMYFPWVGLFEQLRLADDFVFLDDVQYARGFINRVQYKTPSGQAWLTVPLKRHSRDALICELETAEDNQWRDKHLRSLRVSLAGTPYLQDALDLADAVLSRSDLSFSEMLIHGISKVAEYYGLKGKRFYKSSEMKSEGSKSLLIQNLVTKLNGQRYVTGMGALNYLDHEGFDKAGIQVCYMNYRKNEYPQKFAPFTPYVTALDLVANCGGDGIDYINSDVMSWSQALAGRTIE